LDASGVVPKQELKSFAGYSSKVSVHDWLKELQEKYACAIGKSSEKANTLSWLRLLKEPQIEFPHVRTEYGWLHWTISPLNSKTCSVARFLKAVESKLSEICEMIASRPDDLVLHQDIFKKKTDKVGRPSLEG
jgi:hypothetical protein